MLMKMRSYQYNSESHSATLSGFSHAASHFLVVLLWAVCPCFGGTVVVQVDTYLSFDAQSTTGVPA